MYYRFQTKCPSPSVRLRKNNHFLRNNSAGSVETTKEEIIQNSSSLCSVAVLSVEFTAVESAMNGADDAKC